MGCLQNSGSAIELRQQFGAEDRSRTCMVASHHTLLRRVRIPVPPLRHFNLKSSKFEVQGSKCVILTLNLELRTLNCSGEH